MSLRLAQRVSAAHSTPKSEGLGSPQPHSSISLLLTADLVHRSRKWTVPVLRGQLIPHGHLNSPSSWL